MFELKFDAIPLYTNKQTHEHETIRHNELRIENAPNKSKHSELLTKVTETKKMGTPGVPNQKKIDRK